MYIFSSILTLLCLKLLHFFKIKINLINNYKIFKELLPGKCDVYFAQEGEDALIKRLLEHKTHDKFYIDIGAHHPHIFSNTFHFYLNGWRGINIDPVPGMKELFDKHRPGDINLELCISDKDQELDYYMFSQPAFNTCDYENVQEILKRKPNVKIIKKIKIQAKTISQIFDNYIPKNTSIGFLSIDTEGWEYKIITSINFNKFRPKLVLVENLECSLENLDSNNIYNTMKKYDYKFIAKTKNTLFFESNE